MRTCQALKKEKRLPQKKNPNRNARDVTEKKHFDAKLAKKEEERDLKHRPNNQPFDFDTDSLHEVEK
jgi:hypothetical protein